MSQEGQGEELATASRFGSPEDEEVSALEALNMAGIANLGPQVDNRERLTTYLRQCLHKRFC